MSRQLKFMPMHLNGKMVHLVIQKREKDPKENAPGHDTDFTVMFADGEGKWIKPDDVVKGQKADWNLVHFLLCKYLWNTSQPTQYVIDLVEKDKLDDRWEAVARDV